MNKIYQDILRNAQQHKKMLAILIDPEKTSTRMLPAFLKKVNASRASHIFVGGSTDKNNNTASVVAQIKSSSKLPVLLFPGNYNQITEKADGILFLSLLSGNNPEYLIGQHIKAIPQLKRLKIEIIPTGYILIDGGVKTAVQQISETNPIEQHQLEQIIHTALAGQYSGKKMIYLEAGSGAIRQK